MKWGTLILCSCIYDVSHALPQKSVPALKAMSSAKKNQFVALPLVTFFDAEKGEVYNWWAEHEVKGPMSELSYWFLQNSVKSGLAFELSPVLTSKVHLPEAYTKTELTPSQMGELAKAFRASHILKGDVVISKSPLLREGVRLKIQLEILSAQSGERVEEVLRIAEVIPSALTPPVRSEAGEKHVFVETLTSLAESMLNRQKNKPPQWIDVVVSGAMAHSQLQQLKSVLQNNVSGLRDLREKLLAPEQVVWSADYQGAGSSALSEALRQVTPEDFFLQVVQSNAGQILIDAKVKPR